MNLVLGYNGFGRVLGHNHRAFGNCARGRRVGGSPGAVSAVHAFGMRNQVAGCAAAVLR